MKIRYCDADTLIIRIKDRRLICFGAGNKAERLYLHYPQLVSHISYFVDNDKNKWNNYIEYESRKIQIKSPEFLLSDVTEDDIILITCASNSDILNQLQEYDSLKNNECYRINDIDDITYVFNMEEKMWNGSLPPENFRMNDKQKIPKKIHYCWFGRNPLPQDVVKCIDSWKKHCPDYEIIRWDENNYDISGCLYTRQAYEAKKWAFVSDYARIDILYEHGGIYLDTDVEVIKSLEELRYNTAFAGFETPEAVNFGLGVGSIKGLSIFKELREDYNKISFINEDGTLNLTACPKIQTETLKKNGLITNGSFQIVRDIAIYPVEFFSPISGLSLSCKMTANTYSIHHYAASWLSVEYKSNLADFRSKATIARQERGKM